MKSCEPEPFTPMATSGRTTAGQPYRFKGRTDCRGRLFFSPFTAQPRLRAPPRIRQSRSCHRREQSFAHSGVRHALLPPAGDGALLHVGRSSSSSSFLTQGELRAPPTLALRMRCDGMRLLGDFHLRVRTIHAAGDKWADHGGSALPPTTDHSHCRLSFVG